MATHSDGTLEYWHATSRQLLFQKKVSFSRCSTTKCCKLAKSAPLAVTTPSRDSWAECWWDSWTREKPTTWKAAIWDRTKTEFSALSGIPSITTSCSAAASCQDIGEATFRVLHGRGGYRFPWKLDPAGKQQARQPFTHLRYQSGQNKDRTVGPHKRASISPRDGRAYDCH